MTPSERGAMLTDAIPQVVSGMMQALSDMTEIDPNYVLMMTLEFIVYALMKKLPMETEPYLLALIETTKQPDQSDPDFLAKREELYDIIKLVSAR